MTGQRQPATDRRSALRLGVVGFGQLARGYYAPALRALPDLRISVADPRAASRAATRRALPGATLYQHHGELLEREALDAVLVASPPSTHLAIWRDAAERELPVFMEKPFLLAGELERLDPEDPAWARLMIDFNRRFWPPYRDLARQVAAGVPGRPSHARFTLHIDLTAWMRVGDHRTRIDEGGVLHDLGSHALDLVFSTFDELPETISARRSGPGTMAERVELGLVFPSGLEVVCDLAYGHRNREEISIHGERGVLRINDPNGRVWLDAGHSGLRRLLSRGTDAALIIGRALRRRSMLRVSIAAALDAFLRRVLESGPFAPGFADALRVARWTAAAMRSIESGRTVAPGPTGMPVRPLPHHLRRPDPQDHEDPADDHHRFSELSLPWDRYRR